MPDGSRQTRSEPPVATPAEAAVGGIVRDPIDMRDRAHEPRLAPLDVGRRLKANLRRRQPLRSPSDNGPT